MENKEKIGEYDRESFLETITKLRMNELHLDDLGYVYLWNGHKVYRALVSEVSEDNTSDKINIDKLTSDSYFMMILLVDNKETMGID